MTDSDQPVKIGVCVPIAQFGRRAVQKSTELLKLMTSHFELPNEEVSALIDWFRVRLFWPVSKVAALTGIPHARAAAILNLEAEPSPVEKRAIWCLWMAYNAPAQLQDEMGWASWGKQTGADLPVRKQITEEVARVRQYMMDNLKLPKKTLPWFRQEFGLSILRLQSSAKATGYRFSKAKTFRASKLDLWEPRNPYLWLDWRKRDEELTKETNRGLTSLGKWRARYREIIAKKGVAFAKQKYAESGVDPAFIDGLTDRSLTATPRKKSNLVPLKPFNPTAVERLLAKLDPEFLERQKREWKEAQRPTSTIPEPSPATVVPSPEVGNISMSSSSS